MTIGSSTRVAAIDCGTNTIRLLIADLSTGLDGVKLTELTREMTVVRLGEGIDRTGVISAEALRRTSVALANYAVQIADAHVDTVRMVATSASRDAKNGAEFIALTTEILGVAPEIISGDEEARLSFAGAIRGLPSEPRMVVDIGGGSTEFVLGIGDVEAAISTDVGSVRLTERHFAADPPTAAQIAAARADIRAALLDVRRSLAVGDGVGVGIGRSLVAVAGTATTIVAIALGLSEYDSAQIHQSVVSADRIREICSDLIRADHATRTAIAVMHPGRVDVIAAGALILDELISEFGFTSIMASESDILDGIALCLAIPSDS